MKTLIIVKPGWSENSSFVSELLQVVNDHRLKVSSCSTLSMNEAFWRSFYQDLAGFHFFERLLHYMSSAPSLFLIIEGDDAVNIVRQRIVGRKNDGLRGKYRIDELRNVAHASDSEQAAEKELGLVSSFV